MALPKVPTKPPVDPGSWDDRVYGAAGKAGLTMGRLVYAPANSDGFSTTMTITELKIANSDERIHIPVMTATTVWDIKENLATRLGVDATSLTFVTKQGPYWREQMNHEEIRRKVVVKGIKGFDRQRKQYDHPLAIIGAGHIGLRQAMIFLKAGDTNFVVFDRKPQVGGAAWWDQANKSSKLQTEFGVYHLAWDETLPIPKRTYPWPSRDEIIQDFIDTANEQGLMPYIRLDTDVKEMHVHSQKEDSTYDLTLCQSGTDRDEVFTAAGIMLYPGNLSVARRDTYEGEDDFGGLIGYGMFDEINYDSLVGKDVAIIGHGAFAVENIRTCLEYNAGRLYLICRRKNISCPRFVSWLANQSMTPVSAGLFLNAMKPMYDLAGWDVWTYYAVQTNASRSTCSIQQKARFGIGDVYFLAISWGKLEVIVDPQCVKRLTRRCVHLHSGRKVEVDAILKLLGFVGNFANDRLLKIKEMFGFWVNEDPKRWLVAEPVSVMASNFGGTSFSPGVIGWATTAAWFMHFPSDFYNIIVPAGMMPRHKTNGEDVPAYVVDARHGTSTMMIIQACIPFLMERGGVEGSIKYERMRTLHPIRKFIDYCREDWDHYCKKLQAEGLNGPAFPYTPEVADGILGEYMAEHEAAVAKQAAAAK